MGPSVSMVTTLLMCKLENAPTAHKLVWGCWILRCDLYCVILMHLPKMSKFYLTVLELGPLTTCDNWTSKMDHNLWSAEAWPQYAHFKVSRDATGFIAWMGNGDEWGPIFTADEWGWIVSKICLISWITGHYLSEARMLETCPDRAIISKRDRAGLVIFYRFICLIR